METFNHCLICEAEVSQRNFSNFKLCQKFITLASRYYNIHFPDNTVNLHKTLKLNQLNSDSDSAQILVSCNNCFQKITSFCEIYEEVSFLQIHLDASARKITELIKHSNNRNNATQVSGTYECFRNQFYSKVAKHFPHVKLRRLDEKDNVSTIENDPLYIPEENEDSGNEVELDSNQMDNNHHSKDSCSRVPPPPITKSKTHLIVSHQANKVDQETKTSKNVSTGFQNLVVDSSSISIGAAAASNSRTEITHQPNNVDKVIKISKVVSTRFKNLVVDSTSTNGVKNTVEILKSLPQGSLLVVPGRDEAERCHKCRFCDKTFKTRPHRNSHEKVHLQPYQCRFCNRRFSFRGRVIAHERTHTGIKPFRCSVCGETFRERPTCKSHIWLVHKGNGEVIKDLNTAQESNLVEPKIVPNLADPGANPNSEESENPFKCAICLKTFSQRRSLYKHHKIHTKPFNCNICGTKYSFKSSLAYHQRTHTGERPYLCPICFRTFTHHQACKVHQRNVHKIANGVVINTKATGVKVVSANVLPQDNQNVTPENQFVRDIPGTENLQSTIGDDDKFILPDTKHEHPINLNESGSGIVDTPLEDPFRDI